MDTQHLDSARRPIATVNALVTQFTNEVVRDLSGGPINSARFVILSDPDTPGEADILGRVRDAAPVRLRLGGDLAAQMLDIWPRSATEGRRRICAQHVIRLAAGEAAAAQAVENARAFQAERQVAAKRLRRLKEAAETAFPDQEEANLWMDGWRPAWEWRTPQDLAWSSEEDLAGALQRLEEDATWAARMQELEAERRRQGATYTTA